MTRSLVEKREFARILRMTPTAAEAQLWKFLRSSKTGYRFERQMVVRGFIVDFWCPSSRLAIELDGSIHSCADVARNDREKTAALERAGIRMLRLSNDDVFGRMPELLAEIRDAARAGLSRFSAAHKHSAVVADACASVEKFGPHSSVSALPSTRDCKTFPPASDLGGNHAPNPDELADFDRQLADLARSKRMPKVFISPGRRRQMQSQKISLYRRQA